MGLCGIHLKKKLTGPSKKITETCIRKLVPHLPGANELTHWGWVTHICISELTIIGSDNGLLPGRRQAIIWNNAGLLLIEPLGTNFSEISIGIQTFSFKKMHLNMSSAKWRPFWLGLNVLTIFYFLVWLSKKPKYTSTNRLAQYSWGIQRKG